MIRLFTSCLLLLATTLLFAQQPVFEGVSPETDYSSSPELTYQFKDWNVYQIDVQAFDQYVKNAGTEMEFTLQLDGKYDWNVWLEPRDIRSPNYVRRAVTEKGIVEVPRTENLTFRGHLNAPGGGPVALTVDDDFVYGFFNQNGEMYFIEPLWYFVKDQPKDLFVVYAATDVNPRPDAKCGLDELNIQTEKYAPHDDDHHNPSGPENMMGCVEIEIAIASDWLMFQEFGSQAAVEAHETGVLNNVQTNWDNEFNDELQFNIVEFFTVTTSNGDPWTNSTNAGTLLSSFSNWGPGGFNATHDVGGLWTDRNFQGQTIGIAWLSSICTGQRYHCLQNFSTNASFLRVLWSHELGHNFSATHDPQGSPTIMAPSVNGSNNWSGQSQSQINNYYPGRWCLGVCASSQAPIANFSANPTEGCVPMTVQFNDLSLNGPISWNWVFPGGTPATSTQQNPTVTYNFPGVYDVTLTVNNLVGSNTVTQTGLIVVEDVPLATYAFDQVGLTVVFTNTTSSNADSYLWEFGDGNSSTEENPIHTYATDGFYEVSLTASNDCGPNTFILTIPVFNAPLAGFTANPTEGCAAFTVDFTNTSTPNVLEFSWEFPGGTPMTSSVENPSVEYATPGVYDVTLTVVNPAGTSTESFSDYITVGTIPAPGFSFAVNQDTAVFVNSTSNTNGLGTVSYEWDFGDGTTSTDANPTHVYTTNGTFEVTLTATNDCGSATETQTIEIETPPAAGFSATNTSGCEPLTVSFTNESSENATSFNWTFPGGDPGSSTEEEPTVVYNDPGTYHVTLIVSNSAGSDTITLTNYITVDPLPTPGFTSTTNGLEATFSNTSSNATSYSWDFGDGGTSTQANPVYTYAEDGTYTVVLSATNDCGTETLTQTVVIVTPPTAGFSASNASGCAPLTVQFNNESSENATSFSWEFPGGDPATSTVENPTVTYNDPGSYTVTLTVSNAAGNNSTTQTNYVTVTTVPTAGFSVTTNNNNATFDNTSSNATSYEWDFGDGNTSTEEDPTHAYQEDGTYTVELTATNDCGSVTTQQTVTIVTPPTAGFSANVTSGCAPLTVQFNNESSENATSFEWEFPGGDPATSTEENPTVTYNTPGTYSVTLIASNSAGNNTATETNFIVVTTVPDPGFTVQTNILLADFTNTTVNGTTYEWDFGDGNSSTEENPSHEYAEEGAYTVILTATNDCGTNTLTQEVEITSLPVAGFTVNSTTGCVPYTVQFMDQSSNNVQSWFWEFPGGDPATSTAQNPTVTYNSTGSYSVMLTVTNTEGENTVSETNYITVITTPTAGFSSTTNLLTADFNNTSAGAASYEWDFGDGNSSTESDPTHTYDEDGTYTVTLTATNACGSVTATETVTVVSLPTAGFSAGATNGCAPFEVQFTNESSENAETFEWDFPGGDPATSADENPVVTYNSPGVYSVTLTVTNAAGEDVAEETDYIVVGALPDPQFTSDVNGFEVTFTNSSTNPANSGTISYEWDFGDGGTSTAENPVHTYDEDGTYEVTLTVTNDCGSVSFTGEVSIVVPPTAGFSANAISGCTPFEVQFNNESTSNAETFEWEFPGGDPATSMDENPVVTYNSPGVYTVTLTVTNSAGTDTYELTDYITVGTTPAASFDAAINGVDVQFTNTSANATSYEWDFGDGKTSSEQDPAHTYSEDGAYEVVLTATNGCGSVTSTEIIVIATMGPIAAFIVENPEGCVPYEVTFENLSSDNAETFEWEFPGGNPSTSTEENPTVVYDTPGEYDVTLTATNVQGSNTYMEIAYIVVGATPTPGFSASDDMGTVTFTNTSDNAISYEWDFGDGEVSTEENPVHTYSESGEYEVTLKATNDCGFSLISMTVIVMATDVDEIPGIEVFNVFPNPNNGRFTMILRGEARDELEVSFTNVLGQVILQDEIDFRSGQATREFFFNDLAAGMYVFQLRSGNKTLYRKIVIDNN